MRDFDSLRSEAKSLAMTLHNTEQVLEEASWKVINSRSILQDVSSRLEKLEKELEDISNNRYSATLTLLYKLAHHVRNGTKSEFMTTSWAGTALDILAELHNVDPEMYDLYVKKAVI